MNEIVHEINVKPEYAFNDKEVAIIMLNLNYQLVDVIDSIKPLIHYRYLQHVKFNDRPDFMEMLKSNDYKVTYPVALRAYDIVYKTLAKELLNKVTFIRDYETNNVTIDNIPINKISGKHRNQLLTKLHNGAKSIARRLRLLVTNNDIDTTNSKAITERADTIIDAINFGSNILDTIYTIGQYYPLSNTDGLFIIEYITKSSVISNKKYNIEGVDYGNYHLGHDKLKPMLQANTDLIDEFYNNLITEYKNTVGHKDPFDITIDTENGIVRHNNDNNTSTSTSTT